MVDLAYRQVVAADELSDWLDDVADGAGPAMVLLGVPHGWGRSTVLDWLAETAEPREGDPVTFVFRIRAGELPDGRGAQATEIRNSLADAAVRHPVARVMGLDRAAGVAVLGLGVGSLFVSGFGALVGMLLAQEAFTAAGNLRDASAAGQMAALARSARSAAQLSAQVRVVVLIDDADSLDLDLALALLENLTFRDDGQMLIVAAADPASPLAEVLRKRDQLWLAGRVFVAGGGRNRSRGAGIADMGPQSRVELARELCPGLDHALARRIGRKTATFADVFAVGTSERIAELSAGADQASAQAIVDAVIDVAMRRPEPSAAAVAVAWAGGVIHVRQLARALTLTDDAALSADPDLAPVGESHGPVIRLVDPGSPRFAASIQALADRRRREMAAAALQEALDIGADPAEGVVGRIVAGRAAHRIRADLPGECFGDLVQVQRVLVADLEAVGDLTEAAEIAAAALATCADELAYAQDRHVLAAAVLRLAYATASPGEDPIVLELTNEAMRGGAAMGLDARVWAAVDLLGMDGRGEVALRLIDQITTELGSCVDLGDAATTWRLLMAFHAGRAGHPSVAVKPILAPLLTSPDAAVKDAASRMLRIIGDRYADLRLQIEILEAELRTEPSDDYRLTLHDALAGAYNKVGDYGQAVGHAQLALPLYEHLQGPEHPATLAARKNLAEWTGEAGDFARARDLYAGLLPVMERILGPGHPLTLGSRANLARWTGQAGNPARARNLYAGVVPVMERILGPWQTDTLAARGALARWIGEAGNPARARDLHAGLLAVIEQVLGPEHQATLTIRHNLARWTGTAGNPAQARDLCAELLPDRERLLGAEHPDTLDTRINLASFTGQAGDPAWARDMYAGLLPVLERVFGPVHPHVLIARKNLDHWTREAKRPRR